MEDNSPLGERGVSRKTRSYFFVLFGIGMAIISSLRIMRRVRIRGMEHLKTLALRNVLFTPNHHSFLDSFFLTRIIGGWGQCLILD